MMQPANMSDSIAPTNSTCPRTTAQRGWATSLLKTAGLCAVMLMPVVAGGCNIVGFFAAVEESRRKDSDHEVAAEYTGMEGKKWAVIVIADRSVQADNPQLVDRLTSDLSRRLVEGGVGKAGAVAEDVLRFQYNNPRWTTMTYSELAKKLAVERLVVVEILEYRLYEPGNKYLYNGRAAARVGVVEADSAVPDELAFQKQVEIKFPTKEGVGAGDMSAAMVNTALAQRLATRASWYFFDHREPYYPEF